MLTRSGRWHRCVWSVMDSVHMGRECLEQGVREAREGSFVLVLGVCGCLAGGGEPRRFVQQVANKVRRLAQVRGVLWSERGVERERDVPWPVLAGGVWVLCGVWGGGGT